MYPLRLLADRNDVGGFSTPGHNDLCGNSGIFVYDGHRGRVGNAEKGYEIISDILDVTLKAIEGCHCSDVCPICIQSPKCGNQNTPLDPATKVRILAGLYNFSKKSVQFLRNPFSSLFIPVSIKK